MAACSEPKATTAIDSEVDTSIYFRDFGQALWNLLQLLPK